MKFIFFVNLHRSIGVGSSVTRYEHRRQCLFHGILPTSYWQTMKSIELYKDLKSTDVLKAQVVGKNIFSKEIKNQDFFLDYFDFLLQSAVNSDDAEVCDYMLKEAQSALQSYSEACEMSNDKLDFIYDCNGKMQKTVRQISKNNQKIVYDNNAKLIKEINDLYHSLQQNGKSDSVISKITELDSMIVKEAFDQKMKNAYSRLSHDISSFITQSINTDKKNNSLSALQNIKRHLICSMKTKNIRRKRLNWIYCFEQGFSNITFQILTRRL